MKKLLTLAAGLLLAGAISLQAAPEAKKEGEKKQPTAEQKALLKEIKTKYDANKDGKLCKEERAKISSEDKEKMKKAGLGQPAGEKKGEKKKKA